MSDTQLIKDKIDIVDFISEYVQLKPAGINHKACCPFHQEKTPSFMVSRERQSWKCFGCGKGGDIFTFVQELEGMEFVETLKFLADRAGVELSHRVSEINSSQKNRIKDINGEASRFFHNFLFKMPAAVVVLRYLERRGLNYDSIAEWKIGFIPDQWDLLTKYLLKKGYGIDDLVASGLTIQKQGTNEQSRRGYYDRFRGRIMFPIWDVHGVVLGFTGRILVEKENSGGKYINTPQSLVYDKSRVIFGLNKAKQDIKARDLIVMVEGQMDVISSFQAGVKNTVASSGTALTQMQIKLLKRYSKNINMAFDSDEAGIKAARRGIETALKEGMNVKVIQIPPEAGKDPDDCIRQDPATWIKAVKSAKEVMEWYFEMAFSGREVSNPKHKQMIADELLPEIDNIAYAVEKDHWLRELSYRLAVESDILRQDLTRLRKLRHKKLDRLHARISPQEDEKKSELAEKDRLHLLTEKLLALWLKFPGLMNKYFIRADEQALSTTVFAPLYELIKQEYNDSKAIDIELLRARFSDGQHEENIVDSLLMKSEWVITVISEEQAEEEIVSLVDSVNKEWKKKVRSKLQRQIEEAEKQGDNKRIEQLLHEFNQLN